MVGPIQTNGSGQTLFIDLANPSEQLTPALLSQMAANGITEVNLAFNSPSNPNFSQYASEISMIHQAGLKVVVSVGGDKSTSMGNVTAWTVTTTDAQNLANQANE